MKREQLIALVGPTAVGKTEIGIRLARELDGEVVSGDSMQIYKGMDIGTAKVMAEEMNGVPHHMIDIKEPEEPFTVADFQQAATSAIARIHEQGKLPILVGGTGLYVQAVTHEFDFAESESDETFRAEMEAFVSEYGEKALHQELALSDPAAGEAIHANNVRRVIRALEVMHVSGKRFSEQESTQPLPRYDVTMIGLTMERGRLYERINRRVDLMMEAGLEKEVRCLFENDVGGQAIQAIGYKELYAHFRGECSLDEAVDRLKQNSRRYAKRQLTWFRNRTNTTWFDVGESDRQTVFQKILEFVQEMTGNETNIEKEEKGRD
ncbi:tRNA (adenosine(37)-N6)-dimethylallyltransferase MiaA [Shouchella shacheensis]|uniref:tRNA (adenosine(37)-N6)-dimethylallyltransferase MiaA n=1 Tax=Shouchella shacheensis TaxID=1649580 RepID=UPI00074007F6|nr:tRNA (adenosine(37)-N6)-dimethylallyltransferase MiaA [Shouchella shacheensis]